MQIIDHFYLITTSVIIVGLSFLIYMKLGLGQHQSFHVTIYGSNIQSFLLAYRISKLDQSNINITLVGQFDQQFMKIAQAQLNNDMPNVASLNSQYIDRQIIEFCGQEPLLKQLIEDTHLQFKIKRSQILFSKGPSAQITPLQFSKQRYTIDQQRNNMVSSIFKYGLSHITAMTLFEDLEKHLIFGIQNDFYQISMKSIVNKLLPESHKPTDDGIEYLSRVIGLDQKYISDYVSPIIRSQYEGDVNSISTMFRLMPLYCSTDIHNGRTKNLVLHLNQRLISAKILVKLKDKSLTIKRMKLKQYEQDKQGVKLIVTNANNSIQKSFRSDLLIILQNYSEQKQNQFSYHRTIIDGIVANDQQLEQFYSIRFKNSNIISITRLCTNQCKNFKNSAYLVVSKGKLQRKDLIMFTEYQILKNKNWQQARSQLPTSVSKFQQSSHIFRISDTQMISDNYQMKLIVFKNIANLVKKQAMIRRPKRTEKKRQFEGDST